MPHKFRLTWVNVGYGEALLIEALLPDGKWWRAVVDGGSASEQEYARDPFRIPLYQYLKQIGVSHLDLVIHTHPHEDHIGGLVSVLESCSVGRFVQVFSFEQSESWLEKLDFQQDREPRLFMQACQQWKQALQICEAKGIPVESWEVGQEHCFAQDFRFVVLAPLEEMRKEFEALWGQSLQATGSKRLDGLRQIDQICNQLSMVLRLDVGDIRILLPGDTNAEGYSRLSDEAIRANLCKIGHHGQRDGWSLDLQKRVQASDLICCASSDRKYNSADPELLCNLNHQGVRWHFSDYPPVPESMEPVPPHSALRFEFAKGRWERQYI